MSPLKSIIAVTALLSSVLVAVAEDDATRGAPAIAENAYDFNAPNGVPGFGPISPADVAKVLDARSTQ